MGETADSPRRLRRPARLAPAVVADLIDRIVRGEFAEGGSLPAEATLCDEYGISRTVVREAMKMPESDGLVHINHGRRASVADREQWNLLDPVVLRAELVHDPTLTVIDDLVHVRATLETGMAATAATRIDAAGKADLTAAFERLEQLRHATPTDYLSGDGPFHRVIMRASGSRLGLLVVSRIHSQARASSLYFGKVPRSHIVRSHEGHAAIYAAVMAGDADQAAASMREHILGSWLAKRHSRRKPSPGAG